jgi:hypothetical protein
MPMSVPLRMRLGASRARETPHACETCMGLQALGASRTATACATMACVLAVTWLGFFGWLGALLLAIALVLGLLALIAYFGGGSDGLGV